MKSKSIIAVAAIALSSMFSTNAMAQVMGHGHNMQYDNGRRTTIVTTTQYVRNGNFENGTRDHRDDYSHIQNFRGDRRDDYGTRVVRRNRGHRDDFVEVSRTDYVEVHRGHRLDRDGYMIDYDGRVRRLDNGRWGYYRDGAWLVYDCYYEPDFYFSQPVYEFQSHHLTDKEAAAVLGTVVGVAAVAGIISAIVR